MEHLEMNAMGLMPFEEPGIVNYYTLLVPFEDGIFQVDVRMVETPPCHTMQGEDARPATREEAARVIGKMFKALMAPASDVHLPSQEQVMEMAMKIGREWMEKYACRSGKTESPH